MAALQELLERVLALPECDDETAALLRAALAGNRTAELVEKMRERFRTAADATAKPLGPAHLAIGWAVHAALQDLTGETAASARSIRWAEDQIDQADSERTTIPCGPPDIVDADEDESALECWDPAGQPGGRS